MNKNFGKLCFNELAMKKYMPKDTYKKLQSSIIKGEPLSLDVANIVANAMRIWAVENGATHYTHWFAPLTDVSGEKHQSFLTDFSGKELIKGESDASSFPSGGIRATFEARGYTVWDPNSYAFIKDNTLCIPTAFCAYNGESLDKKTPLLRSMEALSTQASRLLALFGEEERVVPTVGVEQEYFLIAKKVYEKRPDLKYCGKTLFGALALKGQELDDHYYANINEKVSLYMKELDFELQKLGITPQTKHNEAAPSQHEVAFLFGTANIAADQNQLAMEVMKSLAKKYELECLLKEKPFAGVNGSGKHLNWSLSTGEDNLLEPGKTPRENNRFLLFLAAIIKAVDTYQELLVASIASPGNDERLGMGEAPPTIISIHVGDDLSEVLMAIKDDKDYISNGENKNERFIISNLPTFSKDVSDRNRTSPFAFTGNKFEFRMPGSATPISEPCYVINTIVADALKDFCDELEYNKDDFDTFEDRVLSLIKRTLKEHERILFNGDSYSKEWQEIESVNRGLYNLNTGAKSLQHIITPKTRELFIRQNVFTERELESRFEIAIESYSKQYKIQADIMIYMAKREILPSLLEYKRNLLENLQLEEDTIVRELLNELTPKIKLFYDNLKKLENLAESSKEELTKLTKNHDREQAKKTAETYQIVRKAMIDLRKISDEIELNCPKKFWPYPSYMNMLYSI
ncbi:MAG: glutamine synthetase III [Defluviitaleaceae bacterium]|nr:glutamine synthetase III [Defluviitaleaceae bacterium]